MCKIIYNINTLQLFLNGFFNDYHFLLVFVTSLSQFCNILTTSTNQP